ncbi:MAG: DUF2380 domain-containing protein [Chitinivibrionales bacterium]|nr:DUF2380 domain-containing protein [Chitinivibrionales bacterium]
MRSLSALVCAAFLCVATTAAQSPPSIAVTDLDAEGLDKSEVKVLSEQLRYELSQAGSFSIVERSRMEDILREQGFQQSGCTSDACAVEMGQLLGVSYMVTGTVGKAGDYTIVNARIVDVGSAKVVVNERVKHSGGIETLIDKRLPEIAERLAAGFTAYTNPEAAAAATEQPADTAAVQDSTGMSRGGKVALISSLAAVAVGGGVVAIVLLSGDDDNNDDDGPAESNIGVVLP